MPAVDRPSLACFLADPARPANTLRYHELQGFLFAVASAPEVLPPSEWLPRIFGEAEAGEATLDHAMLGQIMALYHTITDTVLDPPAGLPTDCLLRADVLANFTDAAPIAQWARGFCRGHRWLDALWEATVPQALDEEFGSVVMTLIFFSSREMAEAFHREAATGGQSFARTATGIHRVLPAASPSMRAWVDRLPPDMQRPPARMSISRVGRRVAATSPVRVAAARRSRTVAE